MLKHWRNEKMVNFIQIVGLVVIMDRVRILFIQIAVIAFRDQEYMFGHQINVHFGDI